MNTGVGLATVTPALAVLAIGLAGPASADSANDARIDGLGGGHPVVVDWTGSPPLQRCKVITSHHDRHDNHGGRESNEFNRIYIYAYCPPNRRMDANPADGRLPHHETSAPPIPRKMVCMSPRIQSKAGDESSARQRILGAADELFYAEGVHTVGIDRVIEHAGVAKASLYRLFGSKENLVGSYLAGRRELRIGDMRNAVAACDDPRDGILAIFDLEAQWLSSPTFRGCPFARATAESAVGSRAHKETAAYRGAILDLFKTLAVEAGADDPDRLAAQLHALYHGAETVLTGSRGDEIIAATRAAVATLVDAACGGWQR